MEKGSVVDTLYYGSFVKASTIAASGNYVYCSGSKAAFKLVENDENISELANPLLEEKLVCVNLGKLAEACDLPMESVQNILAGIRDEIVDHVIVKKGNVSLNFGFGTLNLRAGGSIEFKSNEQINKFLEVD
jgi:hypothetical protein